MAKGDFLFHFVSEAWRHRTLISRLVRRETEARYRGSFLGWFWAILVPLAMLLVYTFVFGAVFGARWARPGNTLATSDYSFPMIMFAGMIVFSLLGDPLARAPGLVLENATYVKKVVFPLEVLPFVALIGGLETSVISFAAFLAVFIGLYGLPPFTILALPLVLLPLMLVTLGLVYFLSSLGVFLRDLRQMMPPAITALLFMSPVFYSIEVVPEQFRWLLLLNPVTPAINHARDVIFWGRLPDPAAWGLYLLVGLLIAVSGAYWFRRTEKAFADVV